MIQRLIARALARLATRLDRRDIVGPDGSVYLERYYLFGRQPPAGMPVRSLRLGWLPWVVYLHHFRRSDNDRDLHNHPFDAVLIGLVGGYFEELPLGPISETQRTRRVWRGAGRVRRLGRDTFHRVDLLDEPRVPVWTIMAAGPKRQGWGFVDLATGVYTDSHDRFGY